MTNLENDLEKLDDAIRLFFRTVKRPQYWSKVTAKSNTNIDRPSAAILKCLIAGKTEVNRVQDLAHTLNIEAPSVTRKTQELEAAGLISRVHDQNDRRITNLGITPKGRELAQRIWKAQRDIMFEALSNWGEVERNEFIDLFDRFCNDFAVASINKINREG